MTSTMHTAKIAITTLAGVATLKSQVQFVVVGARNAAETTASMAVQEKRYE